MYYLICIHALYVIYFSTLVFGEARIDLQVSPLRLIRLRLMILTSVLVHLKSLGNTVNIQRLGQVNTLGEKKETELWADVIRGR